MVEGVPSTCEVPRPILTQTKREREAVREWRRLRETKEKGGEREKGREAGREGGKEEEKMRESSRCHRC